MGIFDILHYISTQSQRMGYIRIEIKNLRVILVLW